MKILIDVPVYDECLRRLEEVQDTEITVVDPAEEPRALPDDVIADTEALFCSVPPVNHQIMKRLKFIQLASVGYDQFLGMGFPGRGIRVCNARGVFDAPIGEWCAAMAVNLVRDLRGMIRNQEKGVWDRAAGFQREIRGMTAGIWGYGGIGRETARLLKSMGLTVHVLVRDRVSSRQDVYQVEGTGDPEGVLPDKVYTVREKSAFLKGLDFLILAVPLAPETRGMIGRDELESLPDSAFILNPARGPIIQERPLIDALRTGSIAGAALDTHYYYPMPPDHP
ncbi:MAG: NAD(P)-dependent oxidoreductase, partial [Spirochaetia bacterium]